MRIAIQMDSNGDYLGWMEGLQLFDMPELCHFFFFKRLFPEWPFLSQACILRN